MEILLTDRLVSICPIGQFGGEDHRMQLPVVLLRKMTGGNPNDWEELLGRVRQDEPKAQRLLFERLWPQVSHRIHGLCPRRESVEDLAQEVYVKIFERLPQFRGGSFHAWVDQITRRTCYDALRKQRVRPEWNFSDLDHDLEIAGGTSDCHLNHDAAEILGKLFTMIPPEMAWLLREVELKERSISELADEMGWTRTAARLRLFRARRRLEETFKKWNQTDETYNAK